MKTKEIGEKLGGLKLGGLFKYRYLVLVLLVGVILIILPTGGLPEGKTDNMTDIEIPDYSLSDEEQRLEQAITRIEGVGQVKVLLSLKGSVARELASDSGEAIVVSQGTGVQNAVAKRYVYPEYLGALVICEGGGEAAVKYDVTRAVQSVTGLSSDRVTVIKMTKNS